MTEAESEIRRSRYFEWRATHPSEAALLESVPPDVIGTLWVSAWKAGAWHALRANASLGLNLSQIIQRLEELASMYADDQLDRALSDELEQASVYWRGEASS